MRAIAKKLRASPCETDFTAFPPVLRISTRAAVPRRRPHALLNRSNVRLLRRAVGRESGALGGR